MGFSDLLNRMLSDWLARKKSRELQEEESQKSNSMRQYQYAVARKSILGPLSSLPIGTCQECIANEKAQRRKERLDLVNRAVVSCPRHAKQAARLRQDMDEVENMRCAKHVYLANDPDAPADLRDNPPPGFKKATPEQLEAMGLKQNALTPAGTQFRAAVYIKDPKVWGPKPDPEAVLAFRGSTSAEEDWKNNFDQNANNDSSYYRRAVQIGNNLAKHGAKVHFSGHSLGGGLASAAQGGSGLTASTYNAAGLHPGTVARYSTNSDNVAAEPGKINAIRLKGEVLTKTQEEGVTGMLACKAVGKKSDMEPSHTPQDFERLKAEGKVAGSDGYSTYLHGMDEVIDSMEKEKVRNEAILKACVNERNP